MRAKLVDLANFIKVDFEQTKSFPLAFQIGSLHNSTNLSHGLITKLEVDRSRTRLVLQTKLFKVDFEQTKSLPLAFQNDSLLGSAYLSG